MGYESTLLACTTSHERDREYRDHWKPVIIRMLGAGKDGSGEPLTDVPEWAKDRYRSERDVRWP